MLNKRSLTQKSTYYMIPVVRSSITVLQQFYNGNSFKTKIIKILKIKTYVTQLKQYLDNSYHLKM